jgi:guanosine-3',5'-bis(diphosphate) 3'-pyrophosphohydrolase
MTRWLKEEPEFLLSSGLLHALRFASLKHRDQRRKDVEKSPYINHLIDVAFILWFEGKVRDPEILMAGILHDTVEDTRTTFEELEVHFGKPVADFVKEVTDDTSLSPQARKQAQIKHSASASEGAKLIKLADKISNLRDINRQPPFGWNHKRAQAYFQWAKEVVAELRGINANLERAFDEIVLDFEGKQSS